MSLTPRQIAAYLEFAETLDNLDRAHALIIAAIGAQGDKDTLDRKIKELTQGWR